MLSVQLPPALRLAKIKGTSKVQLFQLLLISLTLIEIDIHFLDCNIECYMLDNKRPQVYYYCGAINSSSKVEETSVSETQSWWQLNG
jgi:hypothetical protein